MGAIKKVVNNNGTLELQTIVATEEKNNSYWEGFTPYSSSNLSNISLYRRKEGDFWHYIGKADGSGIGDGGYVRYKMKLYDTPPAGFEFISVQCLAGGHDAGRLSPYCNDFQNWGSTANMEILIANFGGSSTTVNITFDFYTKES